MPSCSRSCLILAAAALIASGPAQVFAQSAESQPTERQQLTHPTPEPKTAAVLRFAVQSLTEPQTVQDSSALSARACPAPVPPADGKPQKPLVVDPKILDAISHEMQQKLSAKMTVLVDPAPTDIPAGATVFTGCITRANAGNSAKRLVGMGLGASHLNVHVVALTRTQHGWDPLDTFDIEVKGGSLLPPLGPVGLAVHAARDTQQTLSADARKLADKILKQLKKDMKARAETNSAQAGQQS